ncbi:hypothetical protein K2X85_15010 [bacterium]|jgi:hypothetical protein|nr:hypothetical protein [bacterium]
MAFKPSLQSIILADHIYVDSTTGKKIICGTFNHLTVDAFPSQSMISKYALVALTDVHGAVSIVLKYVDLSTGETLLEMQGLEMEADDPLETVEVVVEITSLPMPHAGYYSLEAHWKSDVLGILRISVDETTPEQAESDD